MLKKLVKYGNSSALVLDKALLEILNIAEGSTLKIKTDGISLIITPVDSSSDNKISSTITPQETFTEAMSKNLDTFTKTKTPGEGQIYLKEIMNIFARYETPIKYLFNNKQFREELDQIEQRFNGNQHNPEYYHAIAQLHQKHNPELMSLEKEVKEISQKYAVEEYQYKDSNNKGALTLAMYEFKKVHEKYAHLRLPIIQLNENSEYIHESVLLAEKYNNAKNSLQYVNEHIQLIAKYIPEYAAYQDEIKKVTEAFQ